MVISPQKLPLQLLLTRARAPTLAPTQRAPSQRWVRHSALLRQTLVLVEGLQLPPQSTSVSAPFLMWSVHENAALEQTPARQLPLWQSSNLEQALPPGQGLHSPPQSTAVSFPFLTPSLQVEPLLVVAQPMHTAAPDEPGLTTLTFARPSLAPSSEIVSPVGSVKVLPTWRRASAKPVWVPGVMSSSDT